MCGCRQIFQKTLSNFPLYIKCGTVTFAIPYQEIACEIENEGVMAIGNK